MNDGTPPAIDFEQAQFDTPAHAETACAVCKKPLDGAYYSVNGHGVCESCLKQLRDRQQGSFFKASLLGMGAGAVGAAVYYGIRSITGYDLALITLVIGVVVGIAVRRGAGASQSLLYRLMAIALTWMAMCSTYIPMIMNDIAPGKGGVGLAIFAAVLSMALPYFLITGGQVLGLIIFGVGIWEAWRRSAPPPFVVEGPFQSAPAAQSPPGAEAQGSGMSSSS